MASEAYRHTKVLRSSRSDILVGFVLLVKHKEGGVKPARIMFPPGMEENFKELKEKYDSEDAEIMNEAKELREWFGSQHEVVRRTVYKRSKFEGSEVAFARCLTALLWWRRGHAKDDKSIWPGFDPPRHNLSFPPNL